MRDPFIQLCKMDTAELFSSVASTLRKFGYSPYLAVHKSAPAYIYGPGRIPVLLVAHADTVVEHPPSVVYYDPAHRVYWAPEGLGADDRAGVFAILNLLRSGHRPHVLITNGEESGCWGALQFARDCPELPVHIIVGLDRRGSQNAVYYSCGSRELRSYVQKMTSFREEVGTVSDVAVIGPILNIASVNLAVGFYHEHTKHEYLCLRDLELTVRVVANILCSPPKRKLPYEPILDEPQSKPSMSPWLRCSSCGSYAYARDTLTVCAQCAPLYSTPVASSDVFICDVCGRISRGPRYAVCADCLDHVAI